MSSNDNAERPIKVIVCGTKFGQVYLEGVASAPAPFELAGIYARGSARSIACAERYGVPLYSDLDDIPDDIDIACVVVRGGLLGGPGVDIAISMMERGIHVLQEHPLHHDELARALKAAKTNGVIYRLNSFYVNLQPVREFLNAVAELAKNQEIRYVDAACGFQVAYALLDIIGQSIGSVRPWGLVTAPLPEQAANFTNFDIPFRSIDGVIGGIPVSLRVQNQLDPADPDNYAHLLHRVTVGAESGSLMLASTHGPVIWLARPNFPHEVQDDKIATTHFGAEDHTAAAPSAATLGAADAPSFDAIFGDMWSHGIHHALERVASSAEAGENPLKLGQYHLSLCQLWQDLTEMLGPPQLVTCQELPDFGVGELEALRQALHAT